MALDTVPATILEQLGGLGRLTAMLGAHCVTGGHDVLCFRFRARAVNKSNTIRVRLAGDDTYTVEFLHYRARPGTRLVSATSGVYADSLRAVIEGETGLRLSL